MRKFLWAVLLALAIVPSVRAEDDEISILIFGGGNSLAKPDTLTEYRNTGPGLGIGVSFKGHTGLEIIPRAAYRYFPLEETKFLESYHYPTDGSAEISGGGFHVWEVYCQFKYGFWEFGEKAPRIYATTGLGLANTSCGTARVATGTDVVEIRMGESKIDIMMQIIGIGLEIPLSKKYAIFAETAYTMVIREKDNTYYYPIQVGLAIKM